MALTGKKVVYNSLPGEMTTFRLEELRAEKDLRDNKLDYSLGIKSVVGEFSIIDLKKNALTAHSFDLVTLVDLVAPPLEGNPRDWLLKSKELLKPCGYILIDENHGVKDNILNHMGEVFPKRERLPIRFRGSPFYDVPPSRNYLYKIG